MKLNQAGRKHDHTAAGNSTAYPLLLINHTRSTTAAYQTRRSVHTTRKVAEVY